MPPEIRRGFVVFAGLLAVVAVIWAARMDAIAPADFSLQNGTDPKTLDPHRASGQPESRIIFEIFEGLLRMLPEGEINPETNIQPLTPQPAIAKSYDISEDGKTYTFHLRDDVRWTDGTPVTAHDFAWSWQRMLHPATACEYGYLINEVQYAQQYHKAIVEIGDQVEVELWDRPEETPTSEANVQHFPRGTMLYGTLREIIKPAEPTLPKDATDEQREEAKLDWQEQWVYVVDVANESADGSVDWDGPTQSRKFCVDVAAASSDESIERTHAVMVAFGKIGGAQAVDDLTFVVRLNNAVPYFLNLVAYYPLFPVNRRCIETHGAPLWTRPENIVTNGPFRLKFRRLRDRVRVERNSDHHAADSIALETVDFISLESQNTALNMYETGQLQWIYDPPTAVIEELMKRPDYIGGPKLSVYFYKMNHAKPPLNDVRVRRALSMAVDRTQIVKQVTKAGQQPAFSVVPPGMAGYESAKGLGEDVEKARELLAEAGFPGGRGFPKITLLYNTSETHRPIAEVIQQQWQNNLNVKIELKNMEWGSFTETVQQEEYTIARYGWVGDYPDPNTFLDLWTSDSPQSNLNWDNAEYDSLIRQAGVEQNPKARLKILQRAEQILIDDAALIPIYFYTANHLLKPNVRGFGATLQELHPLQAIYFADDVQSK
ncbi:peptide ABC transporter substrate-binding protein [Stieleria varia]|uniref:Oligopeptide-binding protein OppA n=1 Tax=Stieleria varia TaxID=2528005 RepID=A0A5C6B8F5_9BACT|nr:peptide ABC transporter substrate-binding protein [Stieleria varia]TWU08248.1 Oligopeptide-binding protein OppA precursor [Stieleria varia]